MFRLPAPDERRILNHRSTGIAARGRPLSCDPAGRKDDRSEKARALWRETDRMGKRPDHNYTYMV